MKRFQSLRPYCVSEWGYGYSKQTWSITGDPRKPTRGPAHAKVHGGGLHRLLHDERPQRILLHRSIRDWTVSDEVHRILAPTLLASTRHDEATPESVQPFFDNIPNVRWEIFENSSRMPFVEEPERYFEVSGRSSPSTTSRSSDEPLAKGPMARYGLISRTYGGSSA